MFTKFLKFRTLAYLYVLAFFLFTMPIYAQAPAGYYDSATGKTGSELKSTLYNIIKGHTEISYDAAYDALEVTDRDPNNANNVILLYSGWSRNAALQYDSGNGWNREHVWAKSHGDFGTTLGAGTDIHHLRAADVSTNSARNNKDFDNGGTQYIDNDDGATDCYTDSDSWEPRDAVKGDVARMIFYMATRYEGENGEPDLEVVDQVNSIILNTTGHGYHGKLSALLEWNTNDPVDDLERNRNNIIYTTYQHNRNPYIDHPEYVDLIWTDNPPPVAPSGLTAANITMTTITLNWTDNSSDEKGFIIYRDGRTTGSIGADSTSYQVNDLSPDTEFNFTVTAFNDNGESIGATLTVSTIPDSSSQTVIDSIFFSEYIEGSSNNKSLEIFNPAENPVSLENYSILFGTNGAPWSDIHYIFPENTILQPGDVWVIANASANQAILDVADDVVSSSVVNFNGDDVRALVMIDGNDTTFLDVIGLYNLIDPGDGWPVAGIENATANHTLVRKSSIMHGNSDWLSSAGTNADDSEWLVLAENTFDYLGSHTVDSVNAIGLCDAEIVPADYRLYACYPNPFNPVTTIRYELRQAANITLQVYDLRGHIIKTLVETMQSAGNYTVTWNATDNYQRNVSAGVYLYCLQTSDGFVRTGKMVLIK